ncbi:MAG: HDIG domain-containing protein [Clostridia bacterium]|nr:HDIG domain-containing protein [Clostridia bacterium]
MNFQSTNTSEWTKQKTLRSALLFVLHFFLLILITAILLFHDHFSDLTAVLKENGANYLYMIFCVLLLVWIMYFYFFFEDRRVLSSAKNIALIFTILNVYIIISFFLGEGVHIYARPVALVALLTFVLLGRRDAIFMNIMCALMMFIIDHFSGREFASHNEIYSSLIISFSAGMIAIFFGDKAKTRFQIVGIGAFIVIPIDLIIFLLGICEFLEAGGSSSELPLFEQVLMRMGYGLFGGVMSAVIFLAVLPVFESMFNCLTAFRLRELTSSDARVLKKLKEEAPGTFNHSMMVAQLAEACATAIGEDVDCARAAAFYHDVGKLHNPEYFTENQGEYNVHDELTPELSADMIRSHAREGYQLIRAHRLPQFLADVAVQHHGTMPIRYFYAKALKMTDGELNIEDFSYTGPKPQSKIAAIIMIADASEAVVRSLNKRTPEATEKAIRDIIEERMELDQFSECDITMADLTKIRQALVASLTGVYHHRVKYPQLKYKHADGKTTGENL